MVMTKHILIDEELNNFINGNKIYGRETPNDILKRELGLSSKNKKLKGGIKNKK